MVRAYRTNNININTSIFKIDFCWCERKKYGGIGWILRRSDGTPVIAGFKVIRRQWRVPWLEALALVDGLKSIPQIYSKLITELDSVQVVNQLEGKEEDI